MKNRRDKVDALFTEEQKKFMKLMKTIPSTVRTEYTYELLVQKNEESATEKKKYFERIAKTYPYASDVQAERELLEIAEQRKNEMKMLSE